MASEIFGWNPTIANIPMSNGGAPTASQSDITHPISIDNVSPTGQQSRSQSDDSSSSHSGLATGNISSHVSRPGYEAAEVDEGDDEGAEGRKKTERRRTGCISCRLRKKKCDEARPVCATCTRLGIECMGYGVKRPGWLRDKQNAAKAKAHLKAAVMKRSAKGKQGESPAPDEAISPTHLGPVAGSSGTSNDDGEWAPTGEVIMPGEWGTTDGTAVASKYGAVGAFEAYDMITGGMGVNAFMGPGTANSAYARTSDDDLSSPGMDLLGPMTDPAETTDGEMNSLWTSLFGNTYPASWGTIPTQHLHPRSPLTADLAGPAGPPFPYYNTPSPTSDLRLSPTPLPSQRNPTDIKYLKHYLQVVMPLQYRVMGISMIMGDFVAPLALSRPEVLASVSSLAALHLVSQRTKNRNRIFPTSSPSSPFIVTTGSGAFRVGSASISELGDDEAIVATSAHQRSIERLKFLSPQDLTTEDVVVLVLFAVSYHLFSGGTSKQLRGMLEVCGRCLSAALASSPELSGDGTVAQPVPSSPWSRYRHLIEHMIWIDVIAAVSTSTPSRLLPTYRRILRHPPAELVAGPGGAGLGGGNDVLLMDKVMGCDSTTLLAFAEISALSHWRDRVSTLGCLSNKELLRRASVIEALLDERSWRESHLSFPGVVGTGGTQSRSMGDGPSENLRRGMSDVFFGGAKVLLGTVVNGPYPRVPDIACAVQETMEAITRLPPTSSQSEATPCEIHRALVLPITLAGLHCETAEQQAFFRGCFGGLGDDARAFGNTGPALELMEEVWRRREEMDHRNSMGGAQQQQWGKGATVVDWREVMRDMGWEIGILLI